MPTPPGPGQGEVAPAGQPSRAWADSLGTSATRAGQILLLVTLAVLIIYALLQITLVLIPVLIALLLAAAFAPLVQVMHRHHVPKMLATMIALTAAAATLGAIITAVVYAFSNHWNSLATKATQALDQLGQFVAQGPLPITPQQLDRARQAIADAVAESVSFSTAVTGLSTVASVLTGLLLMIVVLFFFLKDGRQIWLFLLRPLDGHRRARAQRIGGSSLKVMGGYIRGVGFIALVDAVFIGLGLALLGVPLALPLAVIIFIGAFIPVVGATLAGSLAILVSFVTGGATTAIIAAVIVLAVQQLEGNLLYPLIMGQTVKLHPLVVLLAITAGVLLAGIIGAIVAVPLAGVAWMTMKEWNRPHAETVNGPATKQGVG